VEFCFVIAEVLAKPVPIAVPRAVDPIAVVVFPDQWHFGSTVDEPFVWQFACPEGDVIHPVGAASKALHVLPQGAPDVKLAVAK
jgi:hypothetical protein